MPEPPYKRPPGWRFTFGGINTRDVPDALPPEKYSAAQNIRSTGAASVRTRPGYVPLMTAGNAAITDIRGYATLQTDALPRFLARDANGSVWLDNNTNVGNMNGNAGYGATMLPFRPSESPQSWMYVGAENDYRKFSAPANNNAVTNYKVGIAEPQAQVEAGIQTKGFTPFTGLAGWNNSGTAGAVTSGNRSSDAIGVAIVDPVVSSRWYLQTNANNANAQYTTGEVVSIAGGAVFCIVQDVFPAAPANMTISAITYGAGNVTGPCTITPTVMASNSAYGVIASLRRGSLVTLGASETVLVRDVIYGPSGALAFKAVTVGAFAPGASVVGVPSIAVDTFGISVSNNSSLTSAYLASNITTGVGVITSSYGSNRPFMVPFSSGALPTQDDYFHVSMSIDDPTKLVEALVMLNLDGNNFTSNVLYASIRPGDFVNTLGANAPILDSILSQAEANIVGNLADPGQYPSVPSPGGNNQWLELIMPISGFSRIGTDQSKSIYDVNGVQMKVNVSGNTSFKFANFWITGGGSPDVGNNGSPYKYQAVPLDSLTGTRGNPTPLMHYGVSPRRQPVLLKTSSLNSSYGGNFNTWEVYRYGGSITSYRFIGSVATGSDFVDNVSDAAATAGSPVVFNNTEPWPTIDVPWSQTGNVAAYGPILVASNNTWPATIGRWLPGTIFQVGNNEGYTLRKRPVAQDATHYEFEFEECIGSGNISSVNVLEPNVANQPLPYLWGPNEQGYFFGCGDPYRPGVVSWSKAYAPDAVPTGYNLDLCPPSEPLLGGDVIRGISLVVSSKRWWALYFQPGGTPLYTAVEVPVGKRLAGPFGKCCDGLSIYFWAVDGICATDGGAAMSLTDDDLYNLFPHGGLSGKNVTRGDVTFYAPDYSRAAQFRMAVRDGILYADYRDSNGTPRTLICELAKKAWSQDAYAAPVTVHYAIEQPTGTLELAPSLYPAVVMGDNNGRAWKMQDYSRDNNANIAATITPFEWNGGDIRTNELYGDIFADVVAPSGMTITPISQQVAVYNNTTVAASANRQFQIVPVAASNSNYGGALVQFIGAKFAWSESFNNNQVTQLYLWQPSFVDKPETISTRAGDWDDFGGAAYVRGFKLRADTSGANKTFLIRNSDDNTLYAFAGGPGPSVINHNGEQEITYYFPTPFVSHMARYEPQGTGEMRYFGMEWLRDAWPELSTISSPWMNMGTPEAKYFQGAVITMDTGGKDVEITIKSSDGPTRSITANTTAGEKTPVPFSWTPFIAHEVQLVPSAPVRIWWDEIVWVWEPTPEVAATWETQWTALGGPGYKHIPRIEAAYASSSAVTLTVSSYDGTSPAVITLPGTGGAMRKQLLTPTLNKGQLYKFSIISPEPDLQVFMNDWIVWVADWGRGEGARAYRNLGRDFGDKARI
jgi:hypothetical protein